MAENYGYRCSRGHTVGGTDAEHDCVQIGGALFFFRIDPSCARCFERYLAQGKTREQARQMAKMDIWKPDLPTPSHKKKS